jgi:hypothetical protein
VTVSGRRLRIALPWLSRARLADDATATGRWPATEWLLARARRQDGPRDGPHEWRTWLLEGTPLGPDLLWRFPAGPCVRAAWTGERPVGTWACAAPVHLMAALDHLRLASPAPLPLGVEESRQLVADLNQRLAGRGFTLHEDGHGWLCRCPDHLDCRATPPEQAIGGNLRELMPTGRDAVRLIAWINELQMALHEHPVNARRESRGLPPVNSVWLWGFGEAGPVQGTAAEVLVTDDDWLAGLWRLHGADAAEPSGLATVLAGEAAVVRIGLASAPGTGPTAQDPSARLQALEHQVSLPVRDALQSGSVAEVSMLAGPAVWQLGPAARWRFWRRPRPLPELLP